MLKLRKPRNAYDLLGLPRSATSEKIRARYGQLVRNYERGQSPRQLLEDDQFRRLTNAYLLLVSPERRKYDRRLQENRGRGEPDDVLGGPSEAGVVLVAAEVALLQRKLNDAAELGKEAVKQESRNPRAYALLGDILREQGKYPDALTMYNYAIQFDPDNRRYWQLLQEMTALRDGRTLPRRYRREAPTALSRPLRVWIVVALSLVAVGLSVLYLRTRWSDPWVFGIPVNLTYLALADGFFLGLVLAAAAILMPFDDEMLSYQVAGFGVETTPVGVLVALPGVVFFWAAALFYAIIAYLDEHLSLSIVIALVVCSATTVGLGFAAPKESRLAVYLLGGNFVFFGFLWGWLLGSIRARVFEH